MEAAVEIHGYCEERFVSVKEAFRENFRLGLEGGASFSATIDGEFVVDIWGLANAFISRKSKNER